MKKQVLSMLLAIVMVVGLVPGFAVTASAAEITPSQPANGDGSDGNPYQIGTAEELYWFAQTVNGGNTAICAELMNDITVNTGVLTSEGALNGNGSDFVVWTPIGSTSNRWSGTFEGNGKTISGLYLNDPDMKYIGLFGWTNGGTIQNVKIADSYFSGYQYVAGIVGYAGGSSTGVTITNCENSATIVCNTSGISCSVGGIMGTLYGSGNSSSTSANLIENCVNYGVVDTLCGNVGGIAGYVTLGSYGSMNGCENYGKISGADSVGGICGQQTGGNYSYSSGLYYGILSCNNYGDVTGTSNKVGGIVGYASDARISDCHNEGDVSGGIYGNYSYTGGVVGYFDGNRYSSSYTGVYNCSNSGTVEGEYTSVGGVVGYSRYFNIENCWNTGAVTGANNVGGIVGYLTAYKSGNKLYGHVYSSYNEGDVTATLIKFDLYSNGNGGIAGYAYEIVDCYNVGNVTGGKVGGICGLHNANNGMIANCHVYDVTLTGDEVYPIANSTAVRNCYYRADSDTDGIDGTAAKTAVEFKDGTVRGFLNNGRTGEAAIWYQDTYYPTFKWALPHIHEWTYNVNGTTITAQCANTDELCDNTDGGSVTLSVAESSYVYTGSAIEPAEIRYSDDWVGDKNLSVTYTDNTNVGTATAQLTIEGATVSVNFSIVAEITLNPNGGSLSATTLHTDANGRLTALPTPSNAPVGHSFAGWFTEMTGGTKIETTTAFTQNTTIYAQWTPNMYTITFANTGDSVIEAIMLDYGTQINKPADPVWEGHTFSAWSVEIPDTMPAENMTITAIWDVNTYALSWVVDGKTTTNNVAFGSAIVKPADPKKEGYTFDGWDKAIPATMPAEDVTITAKWTINQYTITFDSNGGSAVTSITQDYDTPVTAPTAPTKGDYIFAGWNPQIPAKMPAENLTLVAQWTRIPDNIVAPTTGGSVLVDDQNPAEGDAVTITPVPDGGMQVDTVTVVDASGEPLTLRDNGDGSYSFVQPEGIVTITVSFVAIPRQTDLWLPVLARLYMTTNPITAIAGEGGTITPEGVTQVKYGRNQAYTITPDEGYIIADVLVNGKSVGAVSEYTFTKVRRPQTIEVIFAPDPDAVVEEPVNDVVDDAADPMYSYEQP